MTRRVAVTLLVIAFVTSACRSTEPMGNIQSTPVAIDPSPTATDPLTATPTDAPIDFCASLGQESSLQVVRASVSRPDESQPAQADSLDTYASFQAMTWASRWIVQARLVADCGDPDGTGFPAYVAQIERTYRGAIRDETIVVRGFGVLLQSSRLPEAGERVMLFLEKSEGQRDSSGFWTVGGPRGVWPVVDDIVGDPWEIFTLTTRDFELAVASALKLGVSPYLPVEPITLKESPTGKDLPSGDVPFPTLCGGSLAQGGSSGRDSDLLVWMSHHVFAGTVLEQLPSTHILEPAPGVDPVLRPLVTDYLVRIEQPVRGKPDDIIRVRRMGGSADGCTLTNTVGQLLVPKERVFLYAWTPEPNAEDPTYYLTGDAAGFWRFSDDGVFVIQDGGEHWTTVVEPVSDLVKRLRMLLVNGLSVSTASQIPIMLDESPVSPPQSWPELTRDAAILWSSFEHRAHGYLLEHPEGWTVLLADHGEQTLSLANYDIDGADVENIPAGGLRIDIQPQSEPAIGYDVTFAVQPEDYTRWISFSDEWSPTHQITVAYEVDGQAWNVIGSFAEPADLRNPNTRMFFSIVHSITHGTAGSGSYTETEAIAHATGMAKSYLGATDPQLVSAELLTLDEALARDAVESGDDPDLASEGWPDADDTMVWRVVFDGDRFQGPKCPPPADFSNPRDGCGHGTSAGIIFKAATGEFISLWIRDIVDD